jgi:hypothetical protein
MAVSRAQLLGALEQFAFNTFFHGWPPANPAPAAVISTVKTTNNNLVESNVDVNCATWIENNMATVIQNWNHEIQGIGLRTDLTPNNIAQTIAHNLNECSAWCKDRKQQVRQLNEMLTHLQNWQPGYRGAYVVVKGLKLIRTFNQ